MMLFRYFVRNFLLIFLFVLISSWFPFFTWFSFCSPWFFIICPHFFLIFIFLSWSLFSFSSWFSFFKCFKCFFEILIIFLFSTLITSNWLFVCTLTDWLFFFTWNSDYCIDCSLTIITVPFLLKLFNVVATTISRGKEYWHFQVIFSNLLQALTSEVSFPFPYNKSISRVVLLLAEFGLSGYLSWERQLFRPHKWHDYSRRLTELNWIYHIWYL